VTAYEPPTRAGRHLDGLLDADIALLIGLHNQVLREAGQGELASLLSAVRTATTRAACGGDQDAPRRIVNALDVSEAARLAQALTVHFHLTNLAEERHRSRGQSGGRSFDAPVTDDVWPAVAALGPQVASRLDRLVIHPVFTAHPTEARRRAVASALSCIAVQLERYDDTRNGPDEQAFARRRMLEEINILHRTSPLRSTPPQPTDEVRTLMTVFDQTLFRAVPRLYRAVERAVGGGDPGRQASIVPPFARFGTWVGGDRDGNPFVTAEVTRQTMAIQSDHVLRALVEGADRVARTLTMSDQNTSASPALRDSLAVDAVTGPQIFAEIAASSPHEPHRHKLLFVAARLGATRRGSVDLAYRDPVDLLADLKLVQASLQLAGDPRSAHGELQHLIWQAETFGFHLAEL